MPWLTSTEPMRYQSAIAGIASPQDNAVAIKKVLDRVLIWFLPKSHVKARARSGAPQQQQRMAQNLCSLKIVRRRPGPYGPPTIAGRFPVPAETQPRQRRTPPRE